MFTQDDIDKLPKLAGTATKLPCTEAEVAAMKLPRPYKRRDKVAIGYEGLTPADEAVVARDKARGSRLVAQTAIVGQVEIVLDGAGQLLLEGTA